jgi:threonine dehydratase
MAYDVSLESIRQARERIRPYIRHTPMAPQPHLTTDVAAHLRLKLENMQVSGSFKPRGVFNNLLQLDEATRKRGVVGASGGNHGVALAYGAHRLGIPAIIYLPATASADRIARVKVWGAELNVVGGVWDETHAAATARAAELNIPYIHPFDADRTIEGQGTLGLELLDDVPDADCVLISIGGGGLIGGMAAAIKQVKPSVKIIGVEPVGAPSMKHSVDLGRLEPLPGVKTIADTLSPQSVSQKTLDLANRYVDDIVLVEDAAMMDAQRWLWLHYNQMVEPAGVAVLAALSQVDVGKYQHPVALICGGNAAADPIWQLYTDMATKKGTIPPKG